MATASAPTHRSVMRPALPVHHSLPHPKEAPSATQRLARAALGLCALAWVSGCALLGPSQEDVALDAQDARLAGVEAVGEAMGQADAQQQRALRSQPLTIVARYNPTSRCGCPPFELFLAGRWRRVALRWTTDVLDPEDALARLQVTVAAATERGIYPLLLVRASLPDESVPGEPLPEYPVAVVSSARQIGAVSLQRAISWSTLDPVELDRRLHPPPRRPEPPLGVPRDPQPSEDDPEL